MKTSKRFTFSPILEYGSVPIYIQGRTFGEPFYHDGMIDRLQRIGKTTDLRITDVRTVLTFLPGWF